MVRHITAFRPCNICEAEPTIVMISATRCGRDSRNKIWPSRHTRPGTPGRLPAKLLGLQPTASASASSSNTTQGKAQKAASSPPLQCSRVAVRKFE